MRFGPDNVDWTGSMKDSGTSKRAAEMPGDCILTDKVFWYLCAGIVMTEDSGPVLPYPHLLSVSLRSKQYI